MKTPLRVLIAEDSADDAELTVRELRRAGYEPAWKRVEVEAEFLAGIKELPDVILSDYSMPHFNGLRAADLLRESGLSIPFILISGTVGEDVAVEAMKHGATDYLLKDRIARLGSAVQRALEQHRLLAERERAERSLALFRTLIDRSIDGIEVIDPETGRFLDINETTCRRLGYSRDEMLAMTVMDIDTVAVSPATWSQHVAEIRRTGFRTIEGQHQRKDGSIFPIEISVRYVTLDRDYLIAAVRDITERRQAEQALRESERRFREMLENVELIAMTLDKNGEVTFCNDHLLQLTGWKREEVIGKDWFTRFIPQRDKALKSLFFDNIAAGTVPHHHENPIMTKDGRLRQIVWNNTALRDAAGHFTGLASIGEDVTERKRTEQALHESEEKFRQLAENINEVFWMTDPAKNQMLYVSPAYEKIWGQSCHSLYASPQNWLASIHPEDRERLLQAAVTKQKRGDYDETYRIIRPDGAIRWIHDRAFPISNAAGEVYRLVGTAEDITENRQLEEQFRQSQKMEAFGQLAGGVAHDFNNILAVIQLQAGMLREEQDLPPAHRDFATEIEKAAERAANLTRQLLLFSRRQKMQPRELNLNEVVTNITKMLNRILGEDIRMQVRYWPQPLFVHGDAGMLDQILMNLAVNSRDAMPNGGRLTIEVSTMEFDALNVLQSPRARTGTFACLAVTDTGSGIPPEVLPQIFEPFFTTKDVGKGTGLGLATVFGIVQQHHGWIDVHSDVGLGTIFRIYLPLSPANGKTEAPDTGSRSVPGGNETILVVEDELQLRALIKQSLSRLGYQVLEAEHGSKALDLWRRHKNQIHLVITDMVMPGGMSGRELGEKLLHERPDLKIIYTSGYSPDLFAKDFEIREGDNFLTKPFQVHKLAETVRARLDSHKT